MQLINHDRAGERILGARASALLARPATDLGLTALLTGDAPRTLTFPEGGSSWELHRGAFRIEGKGHTLMVLTPLDRALRQREREAWQRLVRVLGHEINNSLAPIRSIAESSLALLGRVPRPIDADEDLARGLGVVVKRAEALGRFLAAFASLARVPPPRFEAIPVGAWVARAVAIETRLSVVIEGGPSVMARGDGDQLDQLLINLLRNAVEAALETGGGVRVTWSLVGSHVEVRVLDEGPGIADASGLFVPFFTTKAEGTGIGLALSRQLAEAHGGELTLQNRSDGRGCEARLLLPRGETSLIGYEELGVGGHSG